jgi:hypothetical protein
LAGRTKSITLSKPSKELASPIAQTDRNGVKIESKMTEKQTPGGNNIYIS